MSKPSYLGSAAACALAIAGLTATIPTSTLADTLSPKLSGQVNILSDGIYRGVSQTEGRPQYTAGAQVNLGKFFVGTLFKSMRDRMTGVDNQIQAIVGYKTTLKGLDVTARAIHKQYNGTPASVDNEFMEYEVNVGKKVSKATTGKLTVAYSPDNYGKAKEATYVEVGLDHAVTQKLTLSIANGFRHNENSVDYTNYLIGGRYALSKTLNASLTFTTTDKKRLADRYDDSLFLTLSKKF